jgi:hypothetical protein
VKHLLLGRVLNPSLNRRDAPAGTQYVMRPSVDSDAPDCRYWTSIHYSISRARSIERADPSPDASRSIVDSGVQTVTYKPSRQHPPWRPRASSNDLLSIMCRRTNAYYSTTPEHRWSRTTSIADGEDMLKTKRLSPLQREAIEVDIARYRRGLLRHP